MSEEESSFALFIERQLSPSSRPSSRESFVFEWMPLHRRTAKLKEYGLDGNGNMFETKETNAEKITNRNRVGDEHRAQVQASPDGNGVWDTEGDADKQALTQCLISD